MSEEHVEYKYKNETVCRGCVKLGTACGKCKKCLDGAEHKTITATEMLKESSSYGLQKVFENTHKDDILMRSFENLNSRLNDEIAEFKKALRIFTGNRTVKNAISLCREGGDCIIFISSIMAKALGYKSMRRE